MTGLTSDVFFDVWEPSRDAWHPTKFRSIVVTPKKKRYKLFKIGVLGQVLHRTPKMIVIWESQGKIPKPRFVMDGTKVRYYNEAQIRMMSWHQKNILGPNPLKHRGRFLNHKGFFDAVREDWRIENFRAEDFEYEEIETGVNDVQFG